MKTHKYKKNTLSKGERLGWGKISKEKKVPLREIVSEGKRVVYANTGANHKYLIP